MRCRQLAALFCPAYIFRAGGRQGRSASDAMASFFPASMDAGGMACLACRRAMRCRQLAALFCPAERRLQWEARCHAADRQHGMMPAFAGMMSCRQLTALYLAAGSGGGHEPPGRMVPPGAVPPIGGTVFWRHGFARRQKRGGGGSGPAIAGPARLREMNACRGSEESGTCRGVGGTQAWKAGEAWKRAGKNGW